MSRISSVRAFFILVFFILAFFLLFKPTLAEEKKIYFFWGQGCPHCAGVNQFFEENSFYDKYPIEKKEVYFNRENATALNKFFEKYEVPLDRRGVPVVFIGEDYLIGGLDIPKGFESLAEEFIKSGPSKTKAEATEEAKPEATSSAAVQKTSLLFPAVIAGALADSINPCAFAVLVILLVTITASGLSRRVLLAGLLFSTAIFISYFLMGLGLYKALSWSELPIIFTVVGVLAILMGLLNLKDFFWYGQGGFLMEVPMSWRLRLKSVISGVTSPIGAFFMGFLVSLFLLPCTSGPYIVILGMLSQRTLFAQALGYLVLYNLIFILPMILITLAVYKGLSIQRVEEFRQKRLRLFHLIIGLLLIGMGVIVLAGWV